LSHHLRSRHEVGEVLQSGSVPVTILREGKTVQEGEIDLYINLRYEDIVELKDPVPGTYKVKLALLDAKGKELISRDDLSFEKKDEAKVFAKWWNNDHGNYNKVLKPFEAIKVDGDRARAWLAKGATPSETVQSLFKKAGVYAASPAPGAEAPAPPVATEPPTA